MEEKKFDVEIKKINKKTRQIEWTETIQIPYEVVDKKPEQIKKDNEEIKIHTSENFSFKNKEEFVQENNIEGDNPFHQPSMNTIEFETSDTTIIASIKKYDSKEVTSNDELAAIEKLLERKIISQQEFEEKKRIIVNKIK